jgi:hypothetical protein
MVKKNIVITWIIPLIIGILIIVAGILVFLSIQKTDNFMTCMEIKGLNKCSNIGLTNPSNSVMTDISPERMLENLELYKISCFSISSTTTNYEKTLTFTTKDVLECSGKNPIYQYP